MKIIISYKIRSQLMSLFNVFYLSVFQSVHVSGPPAHYQEIHKAVDATIGSVSAPFCSRVPYVVTCSGVCWSRHQNRSQRTEHGSRTGRILNQWLRLQLCESPDDGPVGPKHVEIGRYTNKIRQNSDISWLLILYTF